MCPTNIFDFVIYVSDAATFDSSFSTILTKLAAKTCFRRPLTHTLLSSSYLHDP